MSRFLLLLSVSSVVGKPLLAASSFCFWLCESFREILCCAFFNCNKTRLESTFSHKHFKTMFQPKKAVAVGVFLKLWYLNYKFKIHSFFRCPFNASVPCHSLFVVRVSVTTRSLIICAIIWEWSTWVWSKKIRKSEKSTWNMSTEFNSLSAWFWDDTFWLPPNVTWSSMKSRSQII